MGRWEPNARGRLEQAALELYVERGYDQTTVAEIAQRAGLTERTFFRYFTDKREVLFYGGQILQETVVGAVAAAPADAAPIEAAQAGVEAAATMMRDWHPHSRRRQSVVGTHPELRERELIKMATLAAAMADTLRERGAGELTAGLAAQAAVAVFHVSFARWVGEEVPEDFVALVRAAFEELRAVTAGGSGASVVED
jgi:AcrR family transcriptional regulator